MKNPLFYTIYSILLLFTLNSCGNSCFSTTCLNEGVCINGECDCAEGYEGPDCGKQTTPSKITIENIKVTKFPATEDNGAGWDILSGADIFVTLSYNDNTEYTHPTYFEDANSSNTYDFVPGINLNLLHPEDKYVIRLYDYDSFDPDDYMGGIEFTPYFDTNDFPKKLNLDAGGDVAFTLDLKYSF